MPDNQKQGISPAEKRPEQIKLDGAPAKAGDGKPAPAANDKKPEVPVKAGDGKATPAPAAGPAKDTAIEPPKGIKVSLIITVLSFILILTVYSRFFRLYMYTALAPLPLASFAGEGTSATGKAFIKSYIGVCSEGIIIVLACLIYSAFLSSSTPSVDPSLPAVTMAWEYLGQLVFNMLVLVGLVKGADHLAKEMFGL